MKVQRLVVTACGIVLVSLIMAGCMRPGYGTPPRTAQNPPIYQGAQDIRQITVDEGMPPPTRVTTFLTDADVESVRTFYMDTLAKDGWKTDNSKGEQKLHFFWVDGCPVYGITVLANALPNSQTQVEIRTTETPCH